MDANSTCARPAVVEHTQVVKLVLQVTQSAMLRMIDDRMLSSNTSHFFMPVSVYIVGRQRPECYKGVGSTNVVGGIFRLVIHHRPYT